MPSEARVRARHETTLRFVPLSLLLIMTLWLRPSAADALEHLKVGGLRIASGSYTYIAKEKGYYAAEGLDVELVKFDAGQPVAVATVSGDIDIGTAGVTSALYTLAGQGALKIIGGSTYDSPGFHGSTFLASNKAYAAGLKSLKDLAGHSIGLTQIGSSYHYTVGLMAEKYHVDLKSLRLMPLQSMSNIASALAGGQTDAAVLVGPLADTLLVHGKAKLLAYIGDEAPWQVGVIFTSTKIANDRGNVLRRFLSATRRGSRDYYNAFVDMDGKRKDGPTAPAILKLVSQFVGQPPAQVERQIGYIDPENRVDVQDIERQISWYRAQGMIKAKFGADQVLDMRYVVPMH
jgi:NitT/TauT family transport system substrate-binding protein